MSFLRLQSHEYSESRARILAGTRIALFVPYANRAKRKILRAFAGDSGFFQNLVDKRPRIEICFSVFSVEAEVRRRSESVPKRFYDGVRFVGFRNSSPHERLRKGIETEFVAAGFGKRGNGRFKVVRDGISENGFYVVDGLSHDVFRRSFPSGMDERGEIYFRVAVGKADDGAIRRSEKYPDVPFQGFFGKEDDRIAVPAIGRGRFAVKKGN